MFPTMRSTFPSDRRRLVLALNLCCLSFLPGCQVKPAVQSERIPMTLKQPGALMPVSTTRQLLVTRTPEGEPVTIAKAAEMLALIEEQVEEYFLFLLLQKVLLYNHSILHSIIFLFFNWFLNNRFSNHSSEINSGKKSPHKNM